MLWGRGVACDSQLLYDFSMNAGGRWMEGAELLLNCTNSSMSSDCSEKGGFRLRGSRSSLNGGTLKAATNGQPLPRNPKPCCFCWCCCCPCPWYYRFISLAVKDNQENCKTKETSNALDGLSCEGEPPPPLEEIRTWGKSFDKLMKSGAGRQVFREFLRCEYSEENILFWLACEELKKENNSDLIEEKARHIYEDYISILSPKEVSLDSRVREIVNRNMVTPTPHTFDEAQLQIYTLMHRDSYPRFVNSPLFKQLAQINNNSESGSEGGGDNQSQQKVNP